MREQPENIKWSKLPKLCTPIYYKACKKINSSALSDEFEKITLYEYCACLPPPMYSFGKLISLHILISQDTSFLKLVYHQLEYGWLPFLVLPFGITT